MAATINIDDELRLATEQLALALSSADDLAGSLRIAAHSEEPSEISLESVGRLALFVSDCEAMTADIMMHTRNMSVAAQTLYYAHVGIGHEESERSRVLVTAWHRESFEDPRA